MAAKPPMKFFYCGNAIRCSSDWKRGSDRRLSICGSALNLKYQTRSSI